MRNTLLFLSTAVVLGVSSCAPRATVLRNPNTPGTIATPSPSSVEQAKAEKAAQIEKEKKEKLLSKERSIALLLPFQLDLIAGTEVHEKDVKRSALALDFYQGFQLGLEEVSKKGKVFRLQVVDSKDNVAYNTSLASSADIEKAGLIVGPVYPQEIRAFGRSLGDDSKLIINPLAASPASDFNINNLVTITPSIIAHTHGMAKKVAQDYIVGNVVIVYQTTDSDSKQFLNGMVTAIRENKPNAHIVTVSSLTQLNEKMTQSGTNHVISGTTDKTLLNNLINNLSKRSSENYYSVKLYGHPLWDRFDFSTHSYFSQLKPIITTESNYKAWTSAARQFREVYKNHYGVIPSDQAFKGYDVAVYFGSLINKYGLDNLKSKLNSEAYEGLFNTYKFTYNENWGFANEAVSFKEYLHGGFQLQ